MRNQNGQEVIQKECDGTYVDEECKIKECKNVEYGCIIQELKNSRQNNQ